MKRPVKSAFASLLGLNRRKPKLSHFSNGECYGGKYRFVTTNLLLDVSQQNNFYIKIPSQHGLTIHREYLYPVYRQGKNELRTPEDLEWPDKLEEALARFPEYQRFLKYYKDWDQALSEESAKSLLHWLLLHILNYERLRSYGDIRSPRQSLCF